MEERELSMKPMLGKLVQEAVKLALIDCVLMRAAEAEEARTGTPWHELTDGLRATFEADVHAIPDELFATMDPSALGQNVACRLLGTGGWSVNGLYSANASVRDVMEETFARPDRNETAEVAFDLRRAMEADEEEAVDG